MSVYVFFSNDYKGNHLSKINVIDKIWDKKSFEVEVIGRCGGDD